MTETGPLEQNRLTLSGSEFQPTLPLLELGGSGSNDAHPSTVDDDIRLDLSEFFALTGGATWIRSDGWRSMAPVCEWFGVNCTSPLTSTSLVGLQLPNNNLAGSVTINFLQLLWYSALLVLMSRILLLCAEHYKILLPSFLALMR
jgi:hypothetical protein